MMRIAKTGTLNKEVIVAFALFEAKESPVLETLDLRIEEDG